MSMRDTFVMVFFFMSVSIAVSLCFAEPACFENDLDLCELHHENTSVRFLKVRLVIRYSRRLFRVELFFFCCCCLFVYTLMQFLPIFLCLADLRETTVFFILTTKNGHHTHL